MDCVITCNIHFVVRQFALFFLELYCIYMGNGASMGIFRKVQARLAPLLVFFVNNNNTRSRYCRKKPKKKGKRGGKRKKIKKNPKKKTKNYFKNSKIK